MISHLLRYITALLCLITNAFQINGSAPQSPTIHDSLRLRLYEHLHLTTPDASALAPCDSGSEGPVTVCWYSAVFDILVSGTVAVNTVNKYTTVRASFLERSEQYTTVGAHFQSTVREHKSNNMVERGQQLEGQTWLILSICHQLEHFGLLLAVDCLLTLPHTQPIGVQ